LFTATALHKSRKVLGHDLNVRHSGNSIALSHRSHLGNGTWSTFQEVSLVFLALQMILFRCVAMLDLAREGI
jgi:hypothetical protein